MIWWNPTAPSSMILCGSFSTTSPNSPKMKSPRTIKYISWTSSKNQFCGQKGKKKPTPSQEAWQLSPKGSWTHYANRRALTSTSGPCYLIPTYPFNHVASRLFRFTHQNQKAAPRVHALTKGAPPQRLSYAAIFLLPNILSHKGSRHPIPKENHQPLPWERKRDSFIRYKSLSNLLFCRLPRTDVIGLIERNPFEGAAISSSTNDQPLKATAARKPIPITPVLLFGFSQCIA